MISLKTFASKTKTIGSSFMKNICIFNMFHHLTAVNSSKSKVFWLGRPRSGRRKRIRIQSYHRIAFEGFQNRYFEPLYGVT